MIYIRSFIFNMLMAFTAIFFSVGGSLLFLFPLKIRFGFILGYALSNLWFLKHICKLDFEVIGRENIPQEAFVLMVKHQSTWETYALQSIFPSHVWVLKKELLRVPFFGWGLAMLEPIAINRNDKKNAMQQIIEQGQKRLDEGRCIVIFPEGTRIPAGKRGRYMMGGARLASATKRKILPVAHNGGEFWPKGSFLIHPGTVRLVIGEPIETEGKKSGEINQIVEDWIEGKMQEITSEKYKPITPI